MKALQKIRTLNVQKSLDLQIFELTQKVRSLEKIISKNTSITIALRNENGLHYIKTDEIIRCKSESNYCQVFLTKGRTLLFSKTLKFIENQLPDCSFLRVHHSHVVNIHMVRKYNADGLQLVDNSIVPISKRVKKEVNFFQLLS